MNVFGQTTHQLDVLNENETRRLGSAYNPTRPDRTDYAPLIKREAIQLLPDLPQNTIPDASIEVVSGNDQELSRHSFSAHAKAAIGLFHSDAGFSDRREFGKNSKTVTVNLNTKLIKFTRRMNQEFGTNALTSEAARLLSNPQSFVKHFGTHVVTHETYGHFLQIQLIFTATKAWSQEELYQRVTASYGSLTSSGQASFESEHKKSEFKENVKITMRYSGRGVSKLPSIDPEFFDQPATSSRSYKAIQKALQDLTNEPPVIVGLIATPNPIIETLEQFEFPDFLQRDAVLIKVYEKFKQYKAVELDAEERLNALKMGCVTDQARSYFAAVKEIFARMAARCADDGVALINAPIDFKSGYVKLPSLTSDSSTIEVTPEASAHFSGKTINTTNLTIKIVCPRVADVQWPLRANNCLPRYVRLETLSAKPKNQVGWPLSIYKDGQPNRPTDRGSYTLVVAVNQSGNKMATGVEYFYFGALGGFGERILGKSFIYELGDSGADVIVTLEWNAKLFGQPPKGDVEGNVQFQLEPGLIVREGLRISSTQLLELLNCARDKQYGIGKPEVNLSQQRYSINDGAIELKLDSGAFRDVAGLEVGVRIREVE